MSFVIGDKNYESPAFDETKYLPIPPFELRLSFIAAQLIAYSGQTLISKGDRKFYYRIFEKNMDMFSSFYIDKVLYLYHIREPPSGKVQFKKNFVYKDPNKKIVKVTEKEEQVYNGMKGLFVDSDTSSSESEEEE